jgi:hypothetical protein
VRVDLAARAAAMLILDVAEAARASDLPCRVGLAVAHVPERRLPTWVPRRTAGLRAAGGVSDEQRLADERASQLVALLGEILPAQSAVCCRVVRGFVRLTPSLAWRFHFLSFLTRTGAT